MTDPIGTQVVNVRIVFEMSDDENDPLPGETIWIGPIGPIPVRADHDRGMDARREASRIAKPQPRATNSWRSYRATQIHWCEWKQCRV